MTDSMARDPLVQADWAEAKYTSAVPDFKGAPDLMFNAPHGWETPDPAWQCSHQGWKPIGLTVPVAGYPLHILGWRFWVPKTELRGVTRRGRVDRVARYAFFAALSSLAFLVLVAFLLGALYLPIAIIVVLVGGSNAFAGSIALFVVMVPMLMLLDFTYLWGLRRGFRGRALAWVTLAPVILLDVMVTQGLGWAFYWATVAYNGEEDFLSGFTLVGALLSLVATVAALITYALKELNLQES